MKRNRYSNNDRCSARLHALLLLLPHSTTRKRLVLDLYDDPLAAASSPGLVHFPKEFYQVSSLEKRSSAALRIPKEEKKTTTDKRNAR